MAMATATAMAMHLSSSSTPSSCCSALKPFVFGAQQQERAGPGPGPGPRELILSGSVRAIRPSEAAGLLQGGSGGGSGGGEEGGFRLLDVRPAWEREKARVGGSLHVPLFVADPDSGPLTLLKRWVHFGYVGLWTGQLLTTMNGHFVADVEALVPDKATKLLVACGEGLRSLIAVRLLHEGGYGNLAWLAGGFNRCVDGDFPEVDGSSKLQYATIGGVSYIFLQLLLLLQVIGNESKER